MSSDLNDFPTLPTTSERDVDLLLWEELRCSLPFVRFFLTTILEQELALSAPPSVWHSLTYDGGENDLTLLVETDGCPTIGVLIENKINAAFTDNQPERYHERGAKGIELGWWEEFKVVLVAPESYLSSTSSVERFDATISYEALKNWFEAQPTDHRARIKATVLHNAIEKKGRGYEAIIDSAVTNFAKLYFERCSSRIPSLNPVKPKPRPKTSTWLNFYPSLPKPLELIHKLSAGYVDLQFNGIKMEILTQLIEGLPLGDAEISNAGKSSALRWYLPKIDCQQSFEEQTEIVDAALEAASQLSTLAQSTELRSRLAQHR